MVKTPALLILLEKDVLNLAYLERPPGELKTVGANRRTKFSGVAEICSYPYQGEVGG